MLTVRLYWPRMRSARLLLCAGALLSGCAAGPRVVLVPEGELIRVGPSVRGRLYTYTDAGWELSSNPVTLPEGWYCGPVDDPPEPE